MEFFKLQHGHVLIYVTVENHFDNAPECTFLDGVSKLTMVAVDGL